MPFGIGLLGLVELTLLVYAVLSVVTTPADQVRALPKLLWLAVVVLLPILGPVAWLLAGRPKGPLLPARPARPTVQRPHPDDDEDFLLELRRRAEQQRRKAQEERGEQP